MGKKRTRKHQKEPNESTHSSDEERPQHDNAARSCPHVMKSVSINGIKKLFKGSVSLGICQSCVKTQVSTASDDSKEEDTESITLLCLQCGNQGCIHKKYQHALTHYQTPRSDKHSLVINTSTWNVWCYECDEAIYVESNKKLLECVNFLQKQAGVTKQDSCSTKSSSVESPQDSLLNDCRAEKEQNLNGLCLSKNKLLDKQDLQNDNEAKKKSDSLKNEFNLCSKLPKVRGLCNLGNTCFFNAIMQNLIQTHWLVQLLNERSPKGTVTQLPGIQCDSSAHHETNEFYLEPLPISLTECGNLTNALVQFFREVTLQGKSGVVNPSPVFEQICKKAPQFRGSKQQDSHELLRHLLDGIRTEETKRQRLGILQAFKLPSKVDPDSVDEKTKSKIKAYGRQASHTIIDSIFSGQLISTVLCKECQVSSQVFEPFLDLSLPIAEEKPLRPGVQKKLSSENAMVDLTATKSSKYMERRAKRKAKKDAKKNTKQRSKSSNDVASESLREAEALFTDQNVDDFSNENNNASEQSDADIEDNTESETTVSSKQHKHSITSQPSSENPPPLEGTLMEGDTEKVADDLDESKHTDLSDLANSPVSFSGDTNANKDVCTALKHLTMQDSEEFPVEKEVDNVSVPMEAGVKREDVEKMEPVKAYKWKFKEDWIAKSLTTLDGRYQPASHECSVLSCLNQFTAPELLTGNNKFGCENCTKLRAEKLGQKLEGRKKELIYSNASKQLLIFSPPAVLTLHLKRFQQVGFSLRKVNRHVDFPLLLDLAPYCSSVCLGLPNMAKGQNHVLYSLYGVAEHSGRLTSGHYTAYIKVRTANVDAKRHFLNLKPAGQYEINKLVLEMSKKAKSIDELHCREPNSDEDVSAQPSPGKWYHISDTYVAEVSEQTVLQSQAYILFYERIL